MSVAERRAREKQARKSLILDAARELFFEKGLEGTTVEDIAERSELSKGTIYLYFPSKEEIYVTIMLEGASILYEMLQEAASIDVPADTLLRRMGQTYYRFYREYTGYFRMLFLYYNSALDIHKKISPELCTQCDQKAVQSIHLAAQMIQRGVDQGVFKSCNSLDFAVLSWTCQNGIILLGEKGDDRHYNLPTSPEKLHDLFLESMIAALKNGR
jgi:AcrR family transcriptional regulator